MNIDLHAAAPHLNPAVAERAALAFTCQAERSNSLLVADMSQPSTSPRLFIFDMRDPSRPQLIERTRVAHGAGSDPMKTGVPQSFGNRQASGKTSLGLYRVADPYIGIHGKSYSLDGLTPGFDDQARARFVMLHPAPYVREIGDVGRSLGCPAINPAVFTQLDRRGALKGSLLWIDGPDPALANAPSLRCAEATPQPAVCRKPDEAIWQWRGSVSSTVNGGGIPWRS
jgi:hypothetical protein